MLKELVPVGSYLETRILLASRIRDGEFPGSGVSQAEDDRSIGVIPEPGDVALLQAIVELPCGLCVVGAGENRVAGADGIDKGSRG